MRHLFCTAKKNMLNYSMKAFSLTTMMFVFQACYGTPRDFGRDAYIQGKVIDKTTGQPIKGIKISANDGLEATNASDSRYEITDNEGTFSMYLPSGKSYTFSFSVQSESKDAVCFQQTDTMICPLRNDNISLSISMEPCH